MDRIDRKILWHLQRQADLSHAELADRVGSSQASVWRRVRALEKDGTLRATVRLVDAAKVGQTVNVLCEVRLRDYSGECVAAFEAFVRDDTRILECFSMSGQWDYLMRVVADGVSGYEEFLMRVLLKHPSVAGASSHFALSVTKYETAMPIPD